MCIRDRYYPYDNLNLDIGKDRFALLYNMYASFQSSYYNRLEGSPVLTPELFKSKAPLFVFDCSRQDDALKSSAVDVRLEFESSTNFPTQTTSYLSLIHI